MTDVVVSWHDQVHVVAEYGLFFGGRHNQKPTICKQNVCRISYAILYAHDLICSNMNNMNLWNLVMLVNVKGSNTGFAAGLPRWQDKLQGGD